MKTKIDMVMFDIDDKKLTQKELDILVEDLNEYLKKYLFFIQESITYGDSNWIIDGG